MYVCMHVYTRDFFDLPDIHSQSEGKGKVLRVLPREGNCRGKLCHAKTIVVAKEDIGNHFLSFSLRFF